MARKAVKTERVVGPNGEEVVVRFYGDASVRLELNRGPWSIDQAWLPGGEGANILLRPAAPAPDMTEDEVDEVTEVTGTVETTGT